jgi:SIR2-like protein
MTEAARPRFDPAASARDARAHGLVAVAGAGLSMGPPSSLPGWTEINDAFLENLALCIAVHTGGEFGRDVLRFVLDRRATADVAQPDLQAQLAEESLGEHYFALFRPLDVETWNDGHAAVAALAATGHLRAIVTTNFDRLLELALEAAGVRHAVYCAPEDFGRLAGPPEPDAVPVIKVHGSVERTETMVDTLRQRVVGRPEELEAALVRLFAGHAVLVVGFSGADLAYDPGYLGLAAGAGASPSFVVVNREGREPTAALAELVGGAGEGARIVDGVLPDCLTALADALGHMGDLVQPAYDPGLELPGLRRAGLSADVHSAWASSLSPVRATVVLASIADAAGSSDAAFRLLMGAMPFHLAAGLHDDPALPAQLAMIAAALIEACHVDDDLSGDTFGGGTAALSVLSLEGVRPDARLLALRALGLALVGEAPLSTAAGLAALEASRAELEPASRADTICALARAWAVEESWAPAYLTALRDTYELMVAWGDEPRRLRVGALLARFLVEEGELDDAAEILLACAPALRRLNLAIPGNDLTAAGGRLYLARGDAGRALSALGSACRNLDDGQHSLRLAENLLPLAEAAAAAGDADALGRAVGRFDELLPLVPGLALAQTASKVRLLCAFGQPAEAREAVAALVSLGERWNGSMSPWLPSLAERLERRIAALEG